MPDKFTVLSSIILGFIADGLIGDPENRFHPIRYIGNLISFFEKKLYKKGGGLKLRGAELFIFSSVIVFLIFKVFDKLFYANPFLYMIYTALFFYFAISSKELNKRGLEIAHLVESGKMENAKDKLKMIVGRDVDHLDEQGVLRATLETISENISDGVISPMFYFMLGGLPLMYLYKTVNTLDSMVGYKNEKYKDFGYVSAKADDILNFVPARVTAFLIYLVTFDKDVLLSIKKYAKAHTSPNAGYPEAAMAGAIKCKFGGVSRYGGVDVIKPVIGDYYKIISMEDIKKGAKINSRVSLMFLILIVLKIYFSGLS